MNVHINPLKFSINSIYLRLMHFPLIFSVLFHSILFILIFLKVLVMIQYNDFRTTNEFHLIAWWCYNNLWEKW